MENFKKKIKIRVSAFAVMVILSAAAGVYNTFFADPSNSESIMWGFEMGAVVSLGILSAFLFARFTAVLHDEKKLRLEFNKENDERMKTIRAKAGVPILPVTSVLMIIAGIIGGYKNPVIFETLLIASLGQLIICAGVKIFYLKKM